MRIHKEINLKELEEKGIDLSRRIKSVIKDYNKDKDTSICLTYTWNLSKCENWGYWYGGTIEKLDEIFINKLGMKAETKRAWDNKTADRYYFFEE